MTDRAALIEKMARAICIQSGGDPNREVHFGDLLWTTFRAKATAALAAYEAHVAGVKVEQPPRPWEGRWNDP